MRTRNPTRKQVEKALKDVSGPQHLYRVKVLTVFDIRSTHRVIAETRALDAATSAKAWQCNALEVESINVLPRKH